jgi:hypothetical protein
MDLGILTSGDERDTEENQQSWVVSGSKKKTKKQKKSKVVIATRVSSRVSIDGRTMMEKLYREHKIRMWLPKVILQPINFLF